MSPADATENSDLEGSQVNRLTNKYVHFSSNDAASKVGIKFVLQTAHMVDCKDVISCAGYCYIKMDNAWLDVILIYILIRDMFNIFTICD